MEFKKRKLLEFDENEKKSQNLDDGTGQYTEIDELLSKNDDDWGYELDDSGMIPKLEELKAQGRNNSKEEIEKLTIKLEEKEFSDENLFEDNDDELEDNPEEFDEEEPEYSPEEIGEDDLPDEYESLYDFEALDRMDDDNFSDLKIDFYDEDEKDETYTEYNSLKESKVLNQSIDNSLKRIANALERIADSLEKR
ncbi:hypothetical protein [Peptostreptococcus canis]|uniref:Uncharacterized protein n=1 Tax=Peptostreptococcus canis TaxID=1159213 RepID=A0ABR6TL65_9FIRM|nr:hypothetical protein [Peptostreptococcus canis]MBC2576136.1 hypothetical protein [Peptostreptococcus canis]MBP1998331.1 hypothetical protein [Peptostreptococcus canis]